MKVTHAGIAVALAVTVVAVIFIFPGLSPFPMSATAVMEAEPAAVDTSITSSDSEITSTTMPMPIENNGQLQVTDAVIGSGAVAEKGDTVTVHYVGTFTDGKQFDSSASHPETASGFSFPLGAGSVIAGWDLGVVGMKVGGKRRLVVPPTLGYGPNDYGPIPGNSTLVFEVELLRVEKGSAR
jgi:FKBP-type peptidyl-prolyl cis-trans isomerase